MSNISYIKLMGQQYRHDNHSVSLINYHFVWIPKRRKKVLTGKIERSLLKLPSLWTRSYFVSTAGNVLE